MFILMTIVHIIVCVFLVIVVLLQSGKAADLAGAFGGMGSQTAFGPRGSTTVLSKATTLAAALFMVSSLALSIMASRSSGSASSVTERSKPAATQSVPAPAPAQSKGQPTVTTTPLGAGGAPAGPSTTVPMPLPPPGQGNTAPAKK